jgi:homoserine dehydrogenase
MRKVSLILMGFGNVGQAVARLILRKSPALEDQFQVRVKVSGIATGRHGRAVDPRGLDLETALTLAQQGKSLGVLSYQQAPQDNCVFIRTWTVMGLLETTPVKPSNRPAGHDHLRAALLSGKHAVTANKGRGARFQG